MVECGIGQDLACIGNVLMLPVYMVWNVNCLGTDVQHGDYIGLQRVTYHKKFGRLNVEMAYQFPVTRLVFITHDFNMVKVVFKVGVLQLAFLVEQISLCGHDQSKVIAQPVEDLFDIVEQFEGLLY